MEGRDEVTKGGNYGVICGRGGNHSDSYFRHDIRS